MAINWLLDKMSSFGNREAMVIMNRPLTYGQLLEHYFKWTCLIQDHHIQPGEVVMVVGDYSPAVCCVMLALIANGNVFVPMLANVHHNREELILIAQVNWLITFTENNYEIESYPYRIHTGLLKDFSIKRQAGIILFTSGTTGIPKAILHDISLFIDRFKFARDTLRTMSFLLFDHIGGINTLFHTFSNGGTIICPSTRLPEKICELIEKHKVELLPTTPSFLNMLLFTEAYKHYDLSSLKIITYGTEVMSEYTLQRMHSQFPQVQMRQTYGLSELGILRSNSKNSVSPWFIIGGEGIEIKIVDSVLHIRSQTAMKGYLNAPNPFDEEGWFNTQDQVLEDGPYIRILGRQSEIINVGGRKVYPAEVEEVLLQMPELRDSTVRGEPNPLLGNIVTAVVNVSSPMSSKELKDRVRSFCREKLEEFQIPVKVYVQDDVLFSNRYKKKRAIDKGGGD